MKFMMKLNTQDSNIFKFYSNVTELKFTPKNTKKTRVYKICID